MNYAFEIDAADVLGVASGASLQEIHDAYRARVKKHHPDVGGEAWAFRAVAKAYELLSQARLRSRVGADWGSAEFTPRATPTPAPSSSSSPSGESPRPAAAPPHAAPTPPHDPYEKPRRPEASRPAAKAARNEAGTVRAGVKDRVDPGKTVDVELFTIRFEIEGPLNLLAVGKDRNLSSCMHVTWPAPPAHEGEPEIRPDPEVLKRLVKVFDGLPKKTKATDSWTRTDGGRFVGWVSYPTASQAFDAFEAFHAAVNEKGLGVRQSTRELFINRNSR